MVKKRHLKALQGLHLYCILAKCVNMQNVQLLQFADGLVLYCSDNIIKSIDNVITALQELKNYYQDKYLEINATKSNVTIFSDETPCADVICM